MAQLTQRRIADLAELDLPSRTTTLVVNGETSDDARFPSADVRRALAVVIKELSGRPGPVIVSGGTDAGVFALLGDVVSDLGFAGPVIGVVPAGKIDKPEGTPLEPHHTDIVMVEGDAWGDETPTMLALCRELDRRGPALALIAGGGEQTIVEIEGHLADHRPVIVLGGTGRSAEQLADRQPTPDTLIVVDVAQVAQDRRWRSALRSPGAEEVASR
jgi:hypothetical protein